MGEARKEDWEGAGKVITRKNEMRKRSRKLREGRDEEEAKSTQGKKGKGKGREGGKVNDEEVVKRSD